MLYRGLYRFLRIHRLWPSLLLSASMSRAIYCSICRELSTAGAYSCAACSQRFRLSTLRLAHFQYLGLAFSEILAFIGRLTIPRTLRLLYVCRKIATR